jgi:3-hydroxyacyl-CoA dehydrogenase
MLLSGALLAGARAARRYYSSVGVVGLGLMGHGIAQVTAEAGVRVVAVDVSASSLDRGMGLIRSSASSAASKAVAKGTVGKEEAEKRVAETLSRISPSTDLGALSSCDLVIEAGPEDAEMKARLYKSLAGVMGGSASSSSSSSILASNTSGLEISWLADQFGSRNRVVGLHYFNPVQVMKLVEIIALPDTPKPTVEALLAFVRKQGKTPVLAADTPGFIVNRLLVPYLASAVSLLDRGVASVEDIDTAMKLGASHPMGPLTLADYVGLDTLLFILQNWSRKYPNEPSFAVPEGLKRLVEAGKLGRKTGEGFFLWKGNVPVGPAKRG